MLEAQRDAPGFGGADDTKQTRAETPEAVDVSWRAPRDQAQLLTIVVKNAAVLIRHRPLTATCANSRLRFG